MPASLSHRGSIIVARMTIEIRTIREDELAAFLVSLVTTFGGDVEIDDGMLARHRSTVGPGQSWAAFDGATIVATAAAFDLELGVPGGGSLPVSGLTMVTVRPTHRRRGLLRRLMDLHLEDARARGRPTSALWASEAPIYGRFGYGLAAFCEVYEIAEAHRLVVDPAQRSDELEWADEARAREVLPAVYARATVARPGAIRRGDVWWRDRRFAELPWARAGASTKRYVLARRGGDVVGYVAFRQRGKFTDGQPDGRVEIDELIGLDPQAMATLWRFALAVDLCPTVSWWNAPADDPLPWLVDDFRRIKRRRGDNLWLRLDDLPATLAARTYGEDGVLRLGVDGTTIELAVEGGRASVAPTGAAPEVELSRQTLGGLFLGVAPATHLAAAGLVRGEPRAIARADRVFSSAIAPWCAEVF
jgi:predicted acetyltransferase